MKVLVITGDVHFSEGNPRFALLATRFEKLTPLYFGRGALFPKIPKGNFNVVTVQDPFWRGVYALYVAHRLQAKFNVQVHADLAGQSFIRRMLARIILHRAHSIRVASLVIKKQIERFNVHAPIQILPIYVDVSSFQNLKREPHEQKTILWVGRFEQEKDPLYAICVLEDVRKTGIDAKLIMLGAGSLEKHLRVRAAGLPTEFPGWRDTKPYLEIADVVLSTSPRESWGASIVEALAAGVPVVSLNVGVAKEAGAIVGTREELTEKIINVLKNGGHGVLRLHVLDANAWADAWKKSL